MRILALHNRYLERGGEDQSHATDVALLRAQGHEVDELVEDNRRVAELGLLRTAFNTLWSVESYRKVRKILAGERYDLVVVQNFFPLLSPSIFYAARSAGVPVVAFIRNYRMFCLNGLALRDQKSCQDCLKKVLPWPGVVHACYRSSRAGSAVVAAMLFVHRLLGTWKRRVDRFIVLTEFAGSLLVQAGLPAEKLIVKPNFVYPDPGEGGSQRGYAFFAGRLSSEKGISTLLDAWDLLQAPVPLKITGDGPLANLVEQAARKNPHIDYLGRRPQEEIYALMKGAMFLVFPTLCYEGMPRVVIESFAAGTPVLASRIGASIEMIEPGQNGWFFPPGDAAGLARLVEQLVSEKGQLQSMQEHARASFEAKYSIARNVAIWERIMASCLATPEVKE